MKKILTLLFFLINLAGFSQDSEIDLYNKAIQNVKDENCNEAVEMFDKIIDNSTNEKLLKMSYIFNSQCLRKLGKYEHSLSSIDKAIEIDPSDQASYFDKIHVLEDMRKYDQILAICKTLQKMKLEKIDQASYYYYLGKTYSAILRSK